jgi:hypothetical protein
LNLPNLHLCITSRPEIDIRNSIEPLTIDRISLHDQSGQQKDIIDFIRAVVYSDKNMRRWRDEDRQIVIETLSQRADGMYGFSYLLGETSSYFHSGFAGFTVSWKPYDTAFRQASFVSSRNYPRLWMRRTNGYYKKYPGRIKFTPTGSFNASPLPFAHSV